MKKIFYVFVVFSGILLVSGGTATAQTQYLDSLYTEIDKATFTYYSKPSEDLKLDLYNPVENTDNDRPLLLYVHGGGFAGGERDHPTHNSFLKNMAARGYVTATMSYTLHMKGKSFGCQRPASTKMETFLKAARDINRATAFMLENQSRFRIDASKIVIIGSSAGAEAVTHAAYWQATRSDSNETILSPEFRYGGIVSMAGALANIRHITDESAVPTQMFHGTCDRLVPYGEAPHHYCSADTPGYLMLYGAHAMMERLRNLQKGYYLVTGCNGRHEWNAWPLSKNRDLITDFVYHDVLKEMKRQIHTIMPSDDNREPCPGLNEFGFCDISRN